MHGVPYSLLVALFIIANALLYVTPTIMREKDVLQQHQRQKQEQQQQ